MPVSSEAPLAEETSKPSMTPTVNESAVSDESLPHDEIPADSKPPEIGNTSAPDEEPVSNDVLIP